MNTSTSETRRTLCQRQFSDGRRCRMLRMDGHPSLCPFHVREEKQLIEADKLGAELVGFDELLFFTDVEGAQAGMAVHAEHAAAAAVGELALTESTACFRRAGVHA